MKLEIAIEFENRVVVGVESVEKEPVESRVGGDRVVGEESAFGEMADAVRGGVDCSHDDVGVRRALDAEQKPGSVLDVKFECDVLGVVVPVEIEQIGRLEKLIVRERCGWRRILCICCVVVSDYDD